MKILLLGSGAREHALAYKIKQSKRCDALFVAPGNAGTKTIATNVEMQVCNFQKIGDFCLKENIKMVVVGPEAPLVEGIYDFFKADEKLKDIIVVGPSKEGAKLEGSKEFAKEFMTRHNIPTAKYKSFTKETIEQGYEFLEQMKAPYVIKADGLASGKGVVIAQDLKQAKEELKSMLVEAKFAQASQRVVIEEFLSGIEMSCFVLTDGKNYKILPSAKDYKRIGEQDKGLNTGGMGAISPVPFADDDFMEKVEQKIVKPTVEAIEKEKIQYRGFIFIGLIKVGDEPFVIEYNVRLGDPETQAVTQRIESDIVELFESFCDGSFKDKELKISPKHSAVVVVASKGYPEKFEKGKTIQGLENVKDSLVFHAGTKEKDGKIISDAGRVLSVSSLENSLEKALEKTYSNIEKIHFDGMYFRSDIGYEFKK